MKRFFTAKNLIILAVIVAAIIGIYFLVRKPSLPEGLIQVNGRIEGDVVVVSSKYSGKITKLLAREGDSVSVGEMVVRLDDPETRDRLAQAQSNLAALLASSTAAGQNVGLTLDTGISSIDQAKGQVTQADSSISDAQAAYGSAMANVKNAAAAVQSAAASKRQSAEAVNAYAAQVETAKANLQSAQKTVDSERAQSKLSGLNAQRFTNLAKEGVVTERQRDEYVTAAEKDRAQLQAAVENASAAKSQISARESDLKKSKEQVEQSTADLARAQAQLASAKQDANAAKARIGKAVGSKTQAQGILKQALTTPTQVAISKSNSSSAKSQVQQAKAQVAEQANVLNNLFVTSPISGMVVTRIRDNGEVVTAGSPILEVVNLDKLYLKAYVPENQIGKIKLGLPAKIYVDAYPDKPFDATVEYISSTAEFTPKEVQTPDERTKLVYAVKLYLKKNPGHKLTPGMPADAIIRWKGGVGWKRPLY